MRNLQGLTTMGLIVGALGLAPAATPQQGAGLDQFLNQHPGVRSRSPQSEGPAATNRGIGDPKARNIYYEGADTQPVAPDGVSAGAASAPAYIGLKYKIIAQGPGGEYREVPETYPFQSGQRFRLVFESNLTGYLYIFQKGSNTKGSRLFPDPRINGGQNQVEAFQEVMIPYSGWFRFDNTVGIEELIVFVTPQRLDTFDNLQVGAGGQMAENNWQVVTAATSDNQPARPDGARGLNAPSAGAAEAAAGEGTPDGAGASREEAASEPGARNIVFEGPDTAPPPVVAPPAESQPAPPPQQPLVYTPPMVEPNNWDVNAPSSAYAVEAAPMLIHHIRLQHNP